MQNQNETREVPLADLIGKVLALAWDPALPVSTTRASGLMCKTDAQGGSVEHNTRRGGGGVQESWGYRKVPGHNRRALAWDLGYRRLADRCSLAHENDRPSPPTLYKPLDTVREFPMRSSS